MGETVKKVLCVAVFITIVVTTWLHLCFCKFNQIGIDTYTIPNTWHDMIAHIHRVMENYPKTMFLYKGRTFENIPCHELTKNARNHNVCIKFNWDNTITYKVNDITKILVVDSINIATCIYVPYDTISYKIGSEDSLFYSISFYDKAKNMIEISRQKPSLPYGGKQNGVWIMTKDYDISTHNLNNLSPFEY